ncbi:hypothetical protein NDN08_007348 [Rhodosorus marinus]|uniref:Uncharacterized protein n=1 Tax=Rhodosorus marinus TaxID=101924 RepID=A0AAV8UG84_9RHOD|nr:hypothetical protein NDN08_007348 [Rhodosorus marinus]
MESSGKEIPEGHVLCIATVIAVFIAAFLSRQTHSVAPLSEGAGVTSAIPSKKTETNSSPGHMHKSWLHLQAPGVDSHDSDEKNCIRCILAPTKDP